MQVKLMKFISFMESRLMKWINFEDELPPKDKPFLGLVFVGLHYSGIDTRKKEIHTCIWDDLHGRFIEYCNCSGCERDLEYIEIVKWMPLPKLPKD